MGVSVLQLSLDQSIRTEDGWGARNKMPIAVGDDCIFLLKYMRQPRVIKINLSDLSVSVSNNIASLFYTASGIELYPIKITIGRTNKIIMDCLVIDRAETSGSRNLYLRRFKVDPTTLAIEAGTQRILSGAANLDYIPEWWRFIRFGETIICPVRTGTFVDGALKVDLHGMRHHIVEIDTTTNAWKNNMRFFHSIMVDRTTNTPYIFCLVHYWATGSYTVSEIIDIKTLTDVAAFTNFEAGCGAITAQRMYRDTTDKVRVFHVGNSGGEQYTSRMGLLYIDNGAQVVEASASIDSSYKDYSDGNTAPIPLGVTSDGKIAWLLAGSQWADNRLAYIDMTEGFQLLKTNDTFGSPTKVASATYPITTSDYIVGDERRVVFLREKDWCYYAPNTIKASSPKDIWYWGKVDLADTGVSIVDDDPYGVVLVPKSGLIPTTLTLQVTPL